MTAFQAKSPSGNDFKAPGKGPFEGIEDLVKSGVGKLRSFFIGQTASSLELPNVCRADPDPDPKPEPKSEPKPEPKPSPVTPPLNNLTDDGDPTGPDDI